jgi:uncharacterized protein (TIGR02145 family)/uncharacterized repeat protein (TIGR02543 family)
MSDNKYFTRKTRALIFPLAFAAMLFTCTPVPDYCGTGTLYDPSCQFCVDGTVYDRGTVTDARDGKTYKTVTIDDKAWMTENLNMETANSWCYGASLDSCAKYGRLYTWEEANTACPSGWHLPSRAEWGALAKAAGGTGTYGADGTAGEKLKSKRGWYSDNGDGNGTNDYEFSALPGGLRASAGSFASAGRYGYWWTSTELNASNAYHRAMYYSDKPFYENSGPKNSGFSVRCIGDIGRYTTLTTNVNPVSSGIVTREPSEARYSAGASVKVTAEAASGYVFTRWSGADTGTANPVTITMDGNKTLTANFQRQGSVNNNCTDSATCKRVTIGGVKWMAENLNIKTDNSWCYNDNDSSCNKYGRLYDWAAAKTACPSGWHLPSSVEWTALVESAGGYLSAGNKLKAASGWNNYEGASGNGTDGSGFSALPGGYRGSNGNFDNAGNFGDWWTATEHGASGVSVRRMFYSGNQVGEYDSEVTTGFSVRCVGD